MKALQFYTATGMRDSERVDSQHGILSPNWKLPPFQIQRPAMSATGLTSLSLVDCDGNSTSILADGTFDIDLVTHERSIYDFMTYNGQALGNYIDYGVYYLEGSDGATTWYSEWMNVKNIQPTVLTGWASNTGYTQFTVIPAGSFENIGIAIATSAGAASALSNAFPARLGEQFWLTSEYTETADTPDVNARIVDSGGATISNVVNLVDGSTNNTTLRMQATDSASQLKITNSEGGFSIDRLGLMRYHGNYVYLTWNNTKDIQGETALDYALTPERESLLYTATGGFKQDLYLDAYLNNPAIEPIEIGDEPNGTFIAEKIISKYLYNVVSYESRATFNATRMLPVHDSINIYDEVGNRYTPSAGNIRVGIDWDTFDTGTLNINWNEDSYIWTNNSDNIV